MEDLSPFVLDLSPLNGSAHGPDVWHDLARQFDVAMRQHGVVYLTGTGVPSSLQSALRSAASTFFGGSIDSKQRFSFAEKYGAEGYSSVGKETIAHTLDESGGKRDVVESLVLHSASSSACPGTLREHVATYIGHMDRLLETLMTLMDLALGVPPPGLSSAFHKPRNALRLAYYPVQGDDAGGQGYGAHTDFSGFTLLSQDAGEAFPAQGSLQLLVNDEWRTVPPIKDGFLVNAGDLIERWTNGLYKSPVHRVILARKRSVPRLSCVYFTAPAHETVIEPLAKCCSEERPAQYTAVCAGEWLEEKLRRTNT